MVKKRIQQFLKKENLVLYGVLFLVGIFRFINLEKIPIFWDEAIYLNLAREILIDKNNLFNSLSVVQFPFLVWILAVFYGVTSGVSHLIASRAVLVCIDLVSGYLVYKIGNRIFGQIPGVISCGIYLLLPLTFFHSRIIQIEALENMLVLAVAYYTLILFEQDYSKSIGFKHFFTLAIMLLLTAFSKPNAIVSLIPIFFIPFFYSVKRGAFLEKKQFILPYIFTYSIAFLSVAAVLMLYRNKFSVYVSTETQTFQIIYAHVKINIWRFAWWVRDYITIPTIIMVVLGVVYSFYKRDKKLIWLVVWMGSVILLSSAIGARIFPRHIYMLSGPVSLLSGYVFSLLYSKNKYVFSILLIGVLFVSFRTDLQISFSPSNAPIALEDRQQFFTNWSSGMGFDDLAMYLKKVSKGKKIIVFHEDDILVSWALPFYFGLKDITYISTDLYTKKKTPFVMSEIKECISQECYLVQNKDLSYPVDTLHLVYVYKEKNRRAIFLYKRT